MNTHKKMSTEKTKTAEKLEIPPECKLRLLDRLITLN